MSELDPHQEDGGLEEFEGVKGGYPAHDFESPFPLLDEIIDSDEGILLRGDDFIFFRDSDGVAESMAEAIEAEQQHAGRLPVVEIAELLLQAVNGEQNSLRMALILSHAKLPELQAAVDLVIEQSLTYQFDLTSTSFANIALLSDELRARGDIKDAAKIVDISLLLAEEAKNPTMYGHALLEVVDFYIERGAGASAFQHLIEAIRYLRDAIDGDALPLLPRIETFKDLCASVDEQVLSLSARELNFLDATADWVLNEAPDPLGGEVIDARIARIRESIQDGEYTSPDVLGRVEEELYPFAASLRDRPDLKDYYGEVVVLLGDVCDLSENRVSALASYLNAIEVFESFEAEADNRRFLYELNAVRGKAIDIMVSMNYSESDPALLSQRKLYLQPETHNI